MLGRQVFTGQDLAASFTVCSQLKAQQIRTPEKSLETYFFAPYTHAADRLTPDRQPEGRRPRAPSAEDLLAKALLAKAVLAKGLPTEDQRAEDQPAEAR